MIDIIGTDPLYWGGGEVNSEKLEKMTYFQLTKELSDLHETSYLEGARNSDLLS